MKQDAKKKTKTKKWRKNKNDNISQKVKKEGQEGEERENGERMVSIRQGPAVQVRCARSFSRPKMPVTNHQEITKKLVQLQKKKRWKKKNFPKFLLCSYKLKWLVLSNCNNIVVSSKRSLTIQFENSSTNKYRFLWKQQSIEMSFPSTLHQYRNWIETIIMLTIIGEKKRSSIKPNQLQIGLQRAK